MRVVAAAPARPVVAAFGELDVSAVGELERALAEAAPDHAAPGHPEDVVLDLAGVTFLDASVLGAFVVQRKKLAGRGTRLVLAGVTPATRRLIELCGLGATLGVEPD